MQQRLTILLGRGAEVLRLALTETWWLVVDGVLDLPFAEMHQESRTMDKCSSIYISLPRYIYTSLECKHPTSWELLAEDLEVTIDHEQAIRSVDLPAGSSVLETSPSIRTMAMNHTNMHPVDHSTRIDLFRLQEG